MHHCIMSRMHPVHRLHNSKHIQLSIVSISTAISSIQKPHKKLFTLAGAGIDRDVVQIKEQAYPRSLELIPGDGYWLLDLYMGESAQCVSEREKGEKRE